VVPIHPVVPNPYTLLTTIPVDFFTDLDLKDYFFGMPLVQDSRNSLPLLGLTQILEASIANMSQGQLTSFWTGIG
jgi:hypothetical protein